MLKSLRQITLFFVLALCVAGAAVATDSALSADGHNKTEAGESVADKDRAKNEADDAVCSYYDKWEMCKRHDELHGTRHYVQGERIKPVRSLPHPYEDIHAQIYAWCRGGVLLDRIIVVFDIAEAPLLEFGDKVVYYKFDNKETVKDLWIMAEGVMGSQANKQRASWLELLAKHETLLLQVQLSEGHSARFRFNLTGTRRAITALSKGCG